MLASCSSKSVKMSFEWIMSSGIPVIILLNNFFRTFLRLSGFENFNEFGAEYIFRIVFILLIGLFPDLLLILITLKLKPSIDNPCMKHSSCRGSSYERYIFQRINLLLKEMKLYIPSNESALSQGGKYDIILYVMKIIWIIWELNEQQKSIVMIESPSIKSREKGYIRAKILRHDIRWHNCSLPD